MKRLIIIIVFLSLYNRGFSQEKEYYRVKDDLKEFILTPYHNEDMVIWKTQVIMSNAERVVYSDTINGFQVEVPDWLDLKETRSLYFFGGTLPAIGEVENAITVRSYEFGGDKSFADFKKYIVENPDYLNGKSPEWSDGKHIIKSIEQSKLLGFDSYKIELEFNQKPYLVNYVLLKTNKSVIWINFAATNETYDVNFVKFKEFMESFIILD